MALLMLMPLIAFAGDDLDIKNQMLDSQIEKLTNERDEKYEALQKCEKSTKGFKIAGITTLVATGVGVYGNIKLSEKLKNGGKGGRGGRSVNLVPRTAEQAIQEDCLYDCPNAESEQCEAYMTCWGEHPDGVGCSCDR